jgi:hypothetical protein
LHGCFPGDGSQGASQPIPLKVLRDRFDPEIDDSAALKQPRKPHDISVIRGTTSAELLEGTKIDCWIIRIFGRKLKMIDV